MIDGYTESLIEESYQQCVKKHGTEYNSLHEAESVLREEIEEVFQEYMDIIDAQVNLWNSTKNNDKERFLENMNYIAESAEKMIKEAAQVAGVCRKALNGFKGDK